MGSANKTGSAERRARIEEMRRAERARERRNRIVTLAASVVVVAGLVVGGVVLIQSQSGDKASAAAGDQKGSGHFVTGSDGVKTWKGTLGRTHTAKTVAYPMEPPVGGDHNPVWQNCDGDVYTKPVDNMNAVHSLEHGAVWVTYNSKASKADVDALAAKVKKTPYTLMSPVDDQKDPIMLSAWAHQRTVTSASDPKVDAFFAQFVQGSQTPEPGAACTGGLGQ
ncbi:DUF3105 domain-containing protein [Streptomyces chiangmaiensis]|uniref:DUF3105 domain-containing protein n=1 Tax=Streptomyces chiangmaiensis TaxID=766497 RepID=A0ABU7FHQ2_9ACTN|nr:DUF3105 domain-containing protein [Streptomyces chiangmaiensis]MED7823661.1 DUF3105 domain-containing protein [Streptomyces chiangmaiensis]